MEQVTVSMKSYCKAFLHAAKYPHSSVNGLLLCEKDVSAGRVNFVDSIPLFHQGLYYSAMTEIALLMVDEYCKRHNLMIAGHYHANANMLDTRVHQTVTKIMEKIQENSGTGYLFMVNNHKISSDDEESCLDMYVCPEGKWVEKFKDGRDSKPLSYELEEGTLPVASELVKESTYEKLIDMDNHFDDVSQDFQNPELNGLIESCSEEM